MLMLMLSYTTDRSFANRSLHRYGSASLPSHQSAFCLPWSMPRHVVLRGQIPLRPLLKCNARPTGSITLSCIRVRPVHGSLQLKVGRHGPAQETGYHQMKGRFAAVTAPPCQYLAPYRNSAPAFLHTHTYAYTCGFGSVEIKIWAPDCINSEGLNAGSIAGTL